jgi:hypothetical protein
LGAAYIYTAVFLAAGTNLNDATGAGLGTDTATHAFVGIHHGQTGFLVNVKRTKIAFLHTVAQAHAAFGAASFSSIKGAGEGTNVSTFIMNLGRGILAAAIAAYHGNLWLKGSSGEP